MNDTDLYLQWGFALFVGLVMLVRRQVSLFSPMTMYLAFHLLVFCLRPTMVHFYDFNFVFQYMVLPIKGHIQQFVLVLSSAALAVFYVAYSIGSAGARPLEFGAKRTLGKHDRAAFYVTALIFGAAGLYSIIKAQPDGERIGGVFVMTGTSGYLNELQQVLIPVCLLFVLVSNWRWWSYLPFAFYMFYRLTQGWGRWTVILTFLCLILVWLWDHRRKFPPLPFLIGGALLGIIFIALSHDRMAIARWIEGDQITENRVLDQSVDWREKYDTLDFANFDFLCYVTACVPDKTGTYTYGTQYLQLFTEPIPRKLWKNKPVGAPIQYFDLNDYGNFIGLTLSLPGDGWQSGGWIGMIITMTLVGGGLGWFYAWFTRNQNIVHRACAFLITDAMLLQLYRDGGISIFKFLLFTLLPLFVWKFLSSRFETAASVAEERGQIARQRLFERQRAAALLDNDPAALEARNESDDDDLEQEDDSDDTDDTDDYDDDDTDEETDDDADDSRDPDGTLEDDESDEDNDTPPRRGRHRR